MISIETINLYFATANNIKIEVQPFHTHSQHIHVKWTLYADDFPVLNWDQNPIGGMTQIPEDVLAAWETDDTVVENWLLEQLQLTRA